MLQPKLQPKRPIATQASRTASNRWLHPPPPPPHTHTHTDFTLCMSNNATLFHFRHTCKRLQVLEGLQVLHDYEATQPTLPARGRCQGHAPQLHDHPSGSAGPALGHRRGARETRAAGKFQCIFSQCLYSAGIRRLSYLSRRKRKCVVAAYCVC
jgi:hypothetical protein